MMNVMKTIKTRQIFEELCLIKMVIQATVASEDRARLLTKPIAFPLY